MIINVLPKLTELVIRFDEDLDSSDEEDGAGSSSSEPGTSDNSNQAQTEEQSDKQTCDSMDMDEGEKGEVKITFVDEVDEAAPEIPENTDLTAESAPSNAPDVQSEDCVSSPVNTLEEQREEKQAQTTCLVEQKQEPVVVDWKQCDSADTMLSDLGADKIKMILSEMGLKCGGTPISRAERLFSIRNLNKNEIPASLFATSGKGRKRKVAEFVDR